MAGRCTASLGSIAGLHMCHCDETNRRGRRRHPQPHASMGAEPAQPPSFTPRLRYVSKNCSQILGIFLPCPIFGHLCFQMVLMITPRNKRLAPPQSASPSGGCRCGQARSSPDQERGSNDLLLFSWLPSDSPRDASHLRQKALSIRRPQTRIMNSQALRPSAAQRFMREFFCFGGVTRAIGTNAATEELHAILGRERATETRNTLRGPVMLPARDEELGNAQGLAEAVRALSSRLVPHMFCRADAHGKHYKKQLCEPPAGITVREGYGRLSGTGPFLRYAKTSCNLAQKPGFLRHCHLHT